MPEVKIVGRGVDTLVINVCYAIVFVITSGPFEEVGLRS